MSGDGKNGFTKRDQAVNPYHTAQGRNAIERGERNAMADAVGIVALAAYFPRTCVAQDALEEHDGVSTGKYTVGLGQSHMTFVTDREDVVSLAMTATERLIKSSGVSYGDIGRLEVGTETVMDRSKSMKSRLMSLFVKSGNTEVEGLDNTNACYGGTAALLNSLAWLRDSAGRYAVVVCADISVYAPGPARATGGAGAVAMLLGRGEEVCIEMEKGLRATHMEDTHDFFKPDFTCEYPVVDGKATVECYTRALDIVYGRWKKRAMAADGLPFNVRCERVQHFLFHAPFNKMVRRALARLLWLDFEQDLHFANDLLFDDVRSYRADVNAAHSREIARKFEKLSSHLYEEKASSAAWLARETGNTYTASLYANLCALIAREGERLVGGRLLLYSFGSGLAATMFSMRVRKAGALVCDVENAIRERIVMTAIDYQKWMEIRERDFNRFAYSPSYPCDMLGQDVFFLESVGVDGRRIYARNTRDEENGVALYVKGGAATCDTKKRKDGAQ